jgi:protein involved in polysaccharide export with SLBB domain
MRMQFPFAQILTALVITGPMVVGGCAAPTVSTEPEQAAAPVLIGPGDRLRVIVFGQNQLSGDFVIADDGNLSLPLAGRIPLAGLTPAQGEKALKDRLEQGIVTKPEVSIDVVRYRPVYVVGEVTRPGGYEPIGELSVINAVALAGGFTYRAQRDQLTLLREGDPHRTPIPVSEATPVGPGDVIIVPERWF